LIKSFFLTAALLAPAFAYAATPSADLSVNVVPAAHSGCLSGSTCPAGVTWTPVLDEEMSKGFLSSAWSAVAGDGLGCNCYSDGVHGWSFPGDGTLTMNGWSAESISPTGKHGGITFGTASIYAVPGYYEMKASIGSDWNAFFTTGAYSCPAVLPGEMDFVENPLAMAFLASYYHDGNTGCEFDHTIVGNFGVSLNTVHVFGMDVSTSRGITSYVDGVAKANMPYSQIPLGLCTDASVCGRPIWLQAGGPGGDAGPMKIYWVRFYTGAPQ
jgi:hypothetical protein